MTSDEFRIVCESGKWANKWVVIRERDGKVMTEGSVKTCLRWVGTWGPTSR